MFGDREDAVDFASLSSSCGRSGGAKLPSWRRWHGEGESTSKVQPGCTGRRCFRKEEFKRAVERHLTGRETEAWELLYFKLYKSQLAVVERALETAGLMLGADKSCGYRLEMTCADFWLE